MKTTLCALLAATSLMACEKPIEPVDRPDTYLKGYDISSRDVEFDIVGEAFGGNYITHLQYRLDEGSWRNVNRSGPASAVQEFHIELDNVPNGKHRLEATVYDSRGKEDPKPLKQEFELDF